MADEAASAAGSSFRPEIQGLRTLAAFLIALHHIWFGRVSGGVDVFFVVSGFLLTGSLTREVTQSGWVRVGQFWTRIARRIFPAAYFIIGVCILGTWIWVSKVFWPDTFEDIRAAATYSANMRFAETSVDYLAQDDFRSPVLHFWAMSIQGQFYLVLPVFMLVAWKLGTALRIRRTWILPVMISIATVTSFVYSVIHTYDTPTSTYFSSFARVWEFGLGALLSLFVARIKVSSLIASALSWVGILVFIGTGIFIVNVPFPGYIALVPTLAAVLLIVAGNAPGQAALHNIPLRFLRTKPMVRLGDYSYSFFLWHWPILVFGKLYFDADSASPLGGIAVMVLALGLSVLTVRFIENPFLRLRKGERKLLSLPELGSVFVAIAVVFGSTYLLNRDALSDIQNEVVNIEDIQDSSEDVTDTENAAAAIKKMEDTIIRDPTLPIRPDPLVARQDMPLPRLQDCIKILASELLPDCTFFGTPGRPRIVLLGGSHSLHWFAPIYAIAQKYDLQLVSLARPGCRFGSERGERCDKWIEQVLQYIEREPPSYIFATATTARDQDEKVGAGFVENWRRVEKIGVHVFAIRDNPEFLEIPSACVDEHRSDPSQCALPRDQLLAPVNPVNDIVDPPSNVTFIDLSDYFCTSTTCHVVRDNIMMYRDDDHITQTFALFLKPLIEEAMRPIFERDGLVTS